eukprot:6591526-Pyramimonas_sp.AAC.1
MSADSNCSRKYQTVRRQSNSQRSVTAALSTCLPPGRATLSPHFITKVAPELGTAHAILTILGVTLKLDTG